MNHQTGIAAVNGTHLYYETAGSGRPLVFIHGFTLDTRMWDDQFWPLAQQFHVIRYDMRGFGQSAVPTDEPYSHVDDLRALLDHLQLQKASLVGLSKGGAVALDFALMDPQRVQALALLDTVLGGHSWSAEGAARDRLVWQRAREGGIPAAKESWLAHPLFAPAMQQTAVATHLTDMINDYSGWHFVHSNPEQGIDPPAAQRLHELQMPVLVIAGELDTPDFLQITAVLGQQIPQAHTAVLPGVGHMVNMEAPELCNTLLLEFLNNL